MRKILQLVLGLVLVAGLIGCARPVASSGVIESNKPRITQPAVSTSDMDTLVEGNNTFAFRLYQSLSVKEGNLFYSPFSISEALAMTYAGARGETEKQMADALSYILAQDKLHPAFNSLDFQLEQRGQGAKGKDEKGFRLNVVNAIWGQKDYTFLAQYLDTLAQNYGAGLRVVDFVNKTEESRKTINDWVAQQTENRIKDLVPPGVINTLTRLVLTNAIYFNAAWAYQFDKEATTNGAFNLLDGSKVTVAMMKESKDLRYIKGTNYEAVELPYDGNQLSMVILVPQSGQFTAFEKSLTGQVVKNIIGKLSATRVNLTMPKFEFESSLGLRDTLSALGMPIAFTEDADFSGMNGKRDLMIQDVLHKAFVSVDEEGTEAAAATAVIVGLTSMPSQQVDLTIDRPFIFLIRDIPTGSIIFVGRVLNPVVR